MTDVEPGRSTPRLTRTEAEDFLFAEVTLLDQGRHDEWLELFADDGLYWVPSNELDPDPDRHVSILYDTKEALEQRILRYQKGRLVQEIPSRTLHQVGNVVVEPHRVGDELVDVRAALVLHEVHAARSSTFPAHCRYLLRPTADGWRIVLKKVAFLANDQYFPNLGFLF